MSLRLRWLIAVTVVAAVAGVGVGGGLGWRWYTSRGPHVRDDLPTLRQAVADVLVAAGDGAAVSVGDLVRARTCPLGPLRTGGVYTLTADLYLDAGAEDTVIGAVADRLPAHYHPQRPAALAGPTRPLTADAGRDVQLAVRQLGDGWVTVTAATGCASGPAQPPDPALPGGDPAVATIVGLLRPLGTTPAAVRRSTLRCPNGGTTVTIAGISQPANTDDIPGRLPTPRDAHRYAVSSANRVAYRSGPVSVIVAASDDNTAITVQHSTSC